MLVLTMPTNVWFQQLSVIVSAPNEKSLIFRFESKFESTIDTGFEERISLRKVQLIDIVSGVSAKILLSCKSIEVLAF